MGGRIGRSFISGRNLLLNASGPPAQARLTSSTPSFLPLLLALLMAISVAGVLLGIRMIRADAKLPGDLALALEVGATRVSKTGSAVDRLGMRFAPLVLRLMGPRRVEAKRHRIDMAGNPGGLTLSRYAARLLETHA